MGGGGVNLGMDQVLLVMIIVQYDKYFLIVEVLKHSIGFCVGI